ncbi:PREDICTED: uncharacterized protein LOC105368115 [Ceratosolen solmsi marchali]|uniref:Uncharacterized protein LOC105368115 n=1 Tax=Ceratosolen solmsi marchali TaxID=326594 RepID=A0AAJ6YVU0_9HYME|nr:PREDICTED: uncharacterized protein LOC105368115 [Ceratosolen solmsi marchali]
MKPQKKSIIGRKATKTSVVAKKRSASLEKSAILELKKEKCFKKLTKLGESKKKIVSELKKKKVIVEKKKEKLPKVDERKQKIIKESIEKPEKKCDRMIEKKIEDREDIDLNDSSDKKKIYKPDDKSKNDKQYTQEAKKQFDKIEEKDEKTKSLNGIEEKITLENKIDDKISMLPVKKRLKEENKRREAKLMKLESKDNLKIITVKDIKKPERKKSPEQETLQKSSPIRIKKELKMKQSSKKNSHRKTAFGTKKPHVPIVKKLFDKKSKLVKSAQGAENLSTSSSSLMNLEIIKDLKQDKKKSVSSKVKDMLAKKFNDEKSVKATIRLSQKNTKMNLIVKNEDKVKNGNLDKNSMKKSDFIKDLDTNFSEIKKSPKEESCVVHTDNIKKEIIDEQEINKIKEDSKKSSKLKIAKKIIKKSFKNSKISNDTDTDKTEITSDENIKQQSKTIENQSKNAVNSTKEEQDLIKVNLKVETVNGESSESVSTSESEDGDEDYARRSRSKTFSKIKERTPSEERVMTNRMKLFGFWSGPKRHRVASLNALAKVHCLYENENGGVYLGGFCKPKPEKEKEKDKENKPRKCKEEKEDKIQQKDKKCNKSKGEETSAKRKLRNVPGLRGKHYDVLEGLTSSSSSDEDIEMRREKEKEKKKKEKEKERLERVKEKKLEEEKEREKKKGEEGNEIEVVPMKKPKQKRRKKNTEIMDLKDMVVCKRMASLNASAILAASYSDEKNRLGTSSESSSSSESDVEFIKRRRQSDSDIDKRKQRQGGSDADDLVKPSKKVMIVNQDTDVTITGVYVNQTRSTHHEGFCSIAGMQYRICSTSHTQTAATAVATELHDQKEQPCKSYTPLGALSSMQPPGSQGNHSNMSPRRHSAFSAPHQHGYYQPAGPLIQHPSTLQSVKGPPPEPTPTPPQNSEGSDDIVATSTTSGGTSSTGGGFYRAYCPQYYATPPQYQDLCYSPSYSHSHPHPPPYYHKYAPPYRRQYYGYQESGPGSGPGGSGAGPGVVEYQPPPGEYLPYYGGYPPPPQPPPPPPNPAYLHSQGRPFVDHAFQSCPCPMQSCPKNADTGPLIGNGKGAPVISGPGLSLPPSALVGPPSPARGLAGLAPPHGANAWDTDRVQLSPAHRSHNQNQQQQQQLQPALSQQAGHSSRVNIDCITKGDAERTEGKMHSSKYAYSQKQVVNCNSGYDVKLEQNVSPANSMTDDSKTTHGASKLHGQQCHQHKKYHRNLKLENNNVKCELCNVEFQQKRIRIGKPATVSAIDEGQQRDQQLEHITCASSCKIKSESGYKCEIFRCEQCMKEAGQLAIMEMNKNSGILDDDAASSKLETDAEVKEELNTLQIDLVQWNKADYEPTASEPVIKDDGTVNGNREEEKEDNTNKYLEKHCNSKLLHQQRCEKVNRRKLSLDSLSDFAKLKKINKRTLSVGSARDFTTSHQVLIAPTVTSNNINGASIDGNEHIKESQNSSRKKLTIKETSNLKRKASNLSLIETPPKKLKTASIKTVASETSIMETINNVIQQSLQMSQKSTKIKKSRSRNNGKVEKKSKRSINLLTTIKCASKKLDLVKAVVSEKLGLIRNEIKNSQQKINNKVDSKIKSKIQNVKAKNSKIKPKLFQVKSKVLESKNNNNKILEIKSNKILEAKNTSNKMSDIKNFKTAGAKNDNKITESKNNINKVIEPKNNKILETKNHKNKSQDGNEIKETKETKEIKSSVITTSIFASNFVSTPFYISELASSKDTKVNKFKGKLQEGVIDIKKSKKKGKNGKKLVRIESFSKIEEQIKDPFDKSLLIPRRPFLKPKWSNGWSWHGEAFEAKVYLTNEESAIRRCYASMRHESGDVLQPLDCVLLKSGPRKADLPFVAKIAALWENPDDGEMMFSLLWYYRPEHTEQGRAENDTDDEVFASRHRDANSVACIEDKCYILTFNEYCRYRKNLRRIEEGLDYPGLIVPPGDQLYPREIRQPPIPVPQDMVLFCRRVYDYRSKKLVKNPG